MFTEMIILAVAAIALIVYVYALMSDKRKEEVAATNNDRYKVKAHFKYDGLRNGVYKTFSRVDLGDGLFVNAKIRAEDYVQHVLSYGISIKNEHFPSHMFYKVTIEKVENENN